MAPGLTPVGKWMAPMIRPEAKMPKPVIALAMKAMAAKNTPSCRRPVFNSESSTTSAIIEENRILAMMPRPTDRILVVKMVPKMIGESLAGNAPIMRSTHRADREGEAGGQQQHGDRPLLETLGQARRDEEGQDRRGQAGEAE